MTVLLNALPGLRRKDLKFPQKKKTPYSSNLHEPQPKKGQTNRRTNNNPSHLAETPVMPKH